MWLDHSIPPQKLIKMHRGQKINHFPGMYHLAKKNFLCHNMNKMYNVFPEEYNFSPQTWTLPAGLPDLKAYFVSLRPQSEDE